MELTACLHDKYNADFVVSVTAAAAMDRGGSRNFHLGRPVKGQANLE